VGLCIARWWGRRGGRLLLFGMGRREKMERARGCWLGGWGGRVQRRGGGLLTGWRGRSAGRYRGRRLVRGRGWLCMGLYCEGGVERGGTVGCGEKGC
jgi:hypothetical protein